MAAPKMATRALLSGVSPVSAATSNPCAHTARRTKKRSHTFTSVAPPFFYSQVFNSAPRVSVGCVLKDASEALSARRFASAKLTVLRNSAGRRRSAPTRVLKNTTY
jgi:hypothetical protein